MFLNAFLIVWRESLEALLVIGVLLAWAGTRADAGALRARIWSGAGAGIAAALAVAATAMAAQRVLSGDGLDLFQTGLLFATWALLTRMVLWMAAHGAGLRRALEARAAEAGSPGGLALVAALAVAREGIEAVLFLLGALAQPAGADLAATAAGALAGLAAAVLCARLVAGGAGRLPLQAVFRISALLLLLVANGMLANGIDRLLARDWLPPLGGLDWYVSAWDSSALLDDTGGPGRVLADFAGYRAQPSLLLLAACGLFWAYLLRRLVWTPARTPR